MTKENHSRPAAANMETARNSRKNVGREAGFAFYYTKEKITPQEPSQRKGLAHTQRIDSRIQNYKCFDARPLPASPQRAEMGRRQLKQTSNLCKTKDSETLQIED